MARRRLSPDEQALWSALTRSVRPIRPGQRQPPSFPPDPPAPAFAAPAINPPARTPAAPAPRSPAAVLDSGWERRIRSGAISPDMSIDLHGHSLAAAHGRLNQAIAAALARDARVLLVVTGKPPRTSPATGASRRGAIRAEIGHWLDVSPHADRIASVRIAHPRHGGDGALYLILRRKK
ncbi:Smr/MutS family protein [Sphingobium sp. CCH11-B1]|jgi:DNA-nicking Smr family endonuclease|uniref:Smr/MutS family protein n=1 Tax=Sphingobium sp. CCH11-B1 TaxID=1768781 RepID=UPI00083675B7|nr:Smr/MutS family protein [Sphingobium sp. CCH11-B1]MEA3389739.1 Smr/MutS family protein [Pseudomonadota bacterium]